MYLNKHYDGQVELIAYEGTTDAMREVETGKLDATLADLPAVVFYGERFKALVPIGAPVGRGYYVIFLSPGETALRDALDRALDKLLAAGQVQKLYGKYNLWNEPLSPDELIFLSADIGPTERCTGDHADQRPMPALPRLQIHTTPFRFFPKKGASYHAAKHVGLARIITIKSPSDFNGDESP